MNDLGQISQELSNEPESLRRSILSGMAKLKGLDLLTGANAFQLDQSRLNERQRAIYKQQGLDVEDGETITNILADNITIPSEPATQAAPAQPVQPEQPVPAPPAAAKPNRILPWLAAGAVTAANLGGGLYFMNKILNKPVPANDSRLTIGLETTEPAQ